MGRGAQKTNLYKPRYSSVFHVILLKIKIKVCTFNPPLRYKITPMSHDSKDIVFEERNKVF